MSIKVDTHGCISSIPICALSLGACHCVRQGELFKCIFARNQLPVDPLASTGGKAGASSAESWADAHHVACPGAHGCGHHSLWLLTVWFWSLHLISPLLSTITDDSWAFNLQKCLAKNALTWKELTFLTEASEKRGDHLVINVQKYEYLYVPYAVLLGFWFVLPKWENCSTAIYNDPIFIKTKITQALKRSKS